MSFLILKVFFSLIVSLPVSLSPKETQLSAMVGVFIHNLFDTWNLATNKKYNVLIWFSEIFYNKVAGYSPEKKHVCSFTFLLNFLAESGHLVMKCPLKMKSSSVSLAAGDLVVGEVEAGCRRSCCTAEDSHREGRKIL